MFHSFIFSLFFLFVLFVLICCDLLCFDLFMGLFSRVLISQGFSEVHLSLVKWYLF